MTITQDGDAVSISPDKDGDALQVLRSPVLDRFTFKVADPDGDFRMTYVDRADAVALARWILKDEA